MLIGDRCVRTVNVCRARDHYNKNKQTQAVDTWWRVNVSMGYKEGFCTMTVCMSDC